MSVASRPQDLAVQSFQNLGGEVEFQVKNSVAIVAQEEDSLPATRQPIPPVERGAFISQ